MSLTPDPIRILFAENIIEICRHRGESQIIAGSQCPTFSTSIRIYLTLSREIEVILQDWQDSKAGRQSEK